jgi:hypothetical protein
MMLQTIASELASLTFPACQLSGCTIIAGALFIMIGREMKEIDLEVSYE